MKIVVLDPFLKNTSGHYFEYNKSVVNELKRRNIDVALYAANTVTPDIQKSIGAMPYFDFLSKNITSLLPNKASRFIKEYRKTFNELPKKAIVFIPNIFTGKQTFLIVIAYLLSSKKQRKLILLIRYLNDSTIQTFLHKLSYFLLKRSLAKDKFILTSDSDIVAQQCLQLFSKKVYVLPIPHIHAITKTKPTQNNNLIKINLPGDGRIEKGIITLMDTIELMIKDNKFSSFELTVQFNPNTTDEKYVAIGKRLHELSNRANIRILSNLSSTNYYEEIANADIILTTYISAPFNGNTGYQARTSGIFTESVAAGKPIITTKDTWMSDQLEKYGSGIAITENSSEELMNALLEISAAMPLYKDKAAKAAEVWLSKHNAGAFCDTFLALP
jgi:glycosyltransferase involved in cell wall biosynthesis